jgi:hypothetical protein
MENTYNNDADRKQLYWNAWRILARNTNLSSEDKHALIEIKRAFFRNDKYDPLLASYVERLSAYMLHKGAYAY